MELTIQAIFISPEHNYFGHYGQPAGQAPLLAVSEVAVVAGRGLVGDRFFDFKTDYKGQVTFFSLEVYEAVRAQLDAPDVGPGVFRRNVIVQGGDLNTLIGKEFSVQGVLFLGMAECTPCAWMDQAFAPGAEAALKGRGGLRAKALADGILRSELPMLPGI